MRRRASRVQRPTPTPTCDVRHGVACSGGPPRMWRSSIGRCGARMIPRVSTNCCSASANFPSSMCRRGLCATVPACPQQARRPSDPAVRVVLMRCAQIRQRPFAPVPPRRHFTSFDRRRIDAQPGISAHVMVDVVVRAQIGRRRHDAIDAAIPQRQRLRIAQQRARIAFDAPRWLDFCRPSRRFFCRWVAFLGCCVVGAKLHRLVPHRGVQARDLFRFGPVYS